MIINFKYNPRQTSQEICFAFPVPKFDRVDSQVAEQIPVAVKVKLKVK